MASEHGNCHSSNRIRHSTGEPWAQRGSPASPLKRSSSSSAKPVPLEWATLNIALVQNLPHLAFEKPICWQKGTSMMRMRVLTLVPFLAMALAACTSISTKPEKGERMNVDQI